MEALKNKHKGESVWIIGKGPSLRFLKKKDIGEGIIITINQSIIQIEALGFENTIYSLQKNGGDKRIKSQDNLFPNCEYSGECKDECGNMVRPKTATLLLHDLESKYCYTDYPKRHVFNLQKIGLPCNVFSLIFAIKIALYMGCVKFKFVSFDAHTVGDFSSFIPKKGIKPENDESCMLYRDQRQRIKHFITGLDCEWIMPEKDRTVSFGVLVNDLMRLDMVFRQSEIQGTANIIKMPETACKGLNKLLGIMEIEEAEIGVLAHQDMYFRQGWIDQMKSQIALLPDSWIVAGIIGKDMDGAICGRVHDMRIPLHFSTNHKFPHPAACFDECCIIVNLKKGFRFDENMPGFDLYGTLCVLQAKEMGGTAWIINAFAEHYCMRSFDWYPGKDFEDCYKWIHKRFPNADRIDTTVIGVERQEGLVN